MITLTKDRAKQLFAIAVRNVAVCPHKSEIPADLHNEEKRLVVIASDLLRKGVHFSYTRYVERHALGKQFWSLLGLKTRVPSEEERQSVEAYAKEGETFFADTVAYVDSFGEVLSLARDCDPDWYGLSDEYAGEIMRLAREMHDGHELNEDDTALICKEHILLRLALKLTEEGPVRVSLSDTGLYFTTREGVGSVEGMQPFSPLAVMRCNAFALHIGAQTEIGKSETQAIVIGLPEHVGSDGTIKFEPCEGADDIIKQMAMRMTLFRDANPRSKQEAEKALKGIERDVAGVRQ
jgi:hypothetical protein